MAEPRKDEIPGLLILPKPKETKMDHGKKSKDFSGTVYSTASTRRGVWVSRLWVMTDDRCDSDSGKTPEVC